MELINLVYFIAGYLAAEIYIILALEWKKYKQNKANEVDDDEIGM